MCSSSSPSSTVITSSNDDNRPNGVNLALQSSIVDESIFSQIRALDDSEEPNLSQRIVYGTLELTSQIISDMDDAIIAAKEHGPDHLQGNLMRLRDSGYSLKAATQSLGFVRLAKEGRRIQCLSQGLGDDGQLEAGAREETMSLRLVEARVVEVKTAYDEVREWVKGQYGDLGVA